MRKTTAALKQAKKRCFAGLINLGRGEVKNFAFQSTANIRLECQIVRNCPGQAPLEIPSGQSRWHWTWPSCGLQIGAGKNLDAASFFSGLIDDVRIYNQAITP
ncbi:MAG: hypothetical protein ACYTBX_20030 [Planctomycetota bacterium]